MAFGDSATAARHASNPAVRLHQSQRDTTRVSTELGGGAGAVGAEAQPAPAQWLPARGMAGYVDFRDDAHAALHRVLHQLAYLACCERDRTSLPLCLC